MNENKNLVLNLNDKGNIEGVEVWGQQKDFEGGNKWGILKSSYNIIQKIKIYNKLNKFS